MGGWDGHDQHAGFDFVLQVGGKVVAWFNVI
jgi:hypothetical protein